jgi:hypothetical protein
MRYQGDTFAGLSVSPKSRRYGTIGNGVKTHPDR